MPPNIFQPVLAALTPYANALAWLRVRIGFGERQLLAEN